MTNEQIIGQVTTKVDGFFTEAKTYNVTQIIDVHGKKAYVTDQYNRKAIAGHNRLVLMEYFVETFEPINQARKEIS